MASETQNPAAAAVAQLEEVLVARQFERDVVERDRAALRDPVVLFRHRFGARPLEECEQRPFAGGEEVLPVAGSPEPAAQLQADQIAPEADRPVERAGHQGQVVDADNANHGDSLTPNPARPSRIGRPSVVSWHWCFHNSASSVLTAPSPDTPARS